MAVPFNNNNNLIQGLLHPGTMNIDTLLQSLTQLQQGGYLPEPTISQELMNAIAAPQPINDPLAFMSYFKNAGTTNQSEWDPSSFMSYFKNAGTSAPTTVDNNRFMQYISQSSQGDPNAFTNYLQNIGAALADNTSAPANTTSAPANTTSAPANTTSAPAEKQYEAPNMMMLQDQTNQVNEIMGLLKNVLPGTGDALGALGMLTGGGVAGMLGSMASNALGRVIGGSPGEQALGASKDALLELGPLLQQLVVNRNAMGQSGQQAAYGARTAMENQGPSAEAMGTAQRLQSEAGRALSEGQQAYESGARTAQLESRNLARQLNQVAGNAPLSSLTSAINAVGEQQSRGNRRALADAAQISNQARALSGQLQGQADNILDTSRKTTFVTKVHPYLNEWDTSAVAPAAGLAQQLGSTAERGAMALIPENPLAGLAGGLGQMGGGILTGWNWGKIAPLQSLIQRLYSEGLQYNIKQEKQPTTGT
jgi:hypothetical protein